MEYTLVYTISAPGIGGSLCFGCSLHLKFKNMIAGLLQMSTQKPSPEILICTAEKGSLSCTSLQGFVP